MTKHARALSVQLRLFSGIALCIALSACGGGGSSATAPVIVPTAAPDIKFVATFVPACSICAPAGQATLDIAPIAGVAMIGNQDIAKVELSVNQGATLVLTAPNAKNAAGQATYAFSFPSPDFAITGISYFCGPTQGLEITVTDVTGFSFKKYVRPCLAEVFDAFSDYGAKTVTYKATASSPASMAFTLQNSLPYLNGRYLDSRTTLETNTTWPLRANDNDQFYATGNDVSKAEGNAVSVSIVGEGGAFASSNVITTKNFRPEASAYLVCCGRGNTTPSPSPTETRTIWFGTYLRSPSVLDSIFFNVYYRVSDPSTGKVVSEYRAIHTGYLNGWPVVVKAGYELTMEASPQDTNIEVTLFVSDRSDPMHRQYSLAMANSNRPDAPAKVNVFCCAQQSAP